MRWKGRRQSDNVEDRRRLSGRKVAAGGGLGALVLMALFWLLGGNPEEVMQTLQTDSGYSIPSTGELSAHDEEMGQFISVVLADTEDVWANLFREYGRTYHVPTLVLYRNQVQSACGFSSAATGPFYCPGDQKVYIDLDFLEQMQRRLGSPGDFAMAYVLAHEVGHHVQNLLGIMDQMPQWQRSLSRREFNQLMVRLELQADFLAGVWVHHAQRMKNILEEGDMQEALNAASAVGDDRIQKQTQGYVVPDSFTHGTSEQRMEWFLKGVKTGDIRRGDTFNADDL